MITQKKIEEIADKLNIYDVVKDDVELKPAGSDYLGLCPFHDDKSPSFRVSPRKNICKCFSCGEGGSPISYYIKKNGCDFPTAIRALAKKVGVTIEEEEESANQRIERLHKEALEGLNLRVFRFYAGILKESEEAKDYIRERLGDGYMSCEDFGFAPNKSDVLVRWAQEKGENIDYLMELGWIKTGRSGWSEDSVINRIIVPVKDVFSRIEGYVARTMSNDPKTVKRFKYINTPECTTFHKSEIVFGLDVAKREGKAKGIMYLVEGMFDAIKMRSVGIENTVAGLGGEWSESQLKQIRRYTNAICFINDADPVDVGKDWGHGIDFVMKNGVKALRLGMKVNVRELPTLPDNQKQDPAMFFTDSSKLSELLEEDYILWYARKKFKASKGMNNIPELMKEISSFVAFIKDNVDREYLLNELNKVYRNKGIWKKYVEQAVQNLKDSGSESQKSKYEDYGFSVRNDCYYGNLGNASGEWSNFTLTPLFHIKDKQEPRRIFMIRNTAGDSDIVDFTMEELCSIGKMKQKLEGLGNYMWMTTEMNFSKVKRYLFDNTEVATPIKQMGWNQHGFYAYGNAVWSEGTFYYADEYGMCMLEDGSKWYIPAASPVYRDNEMFYELEKRFVYKKQTNMTVESFLRKFFEVFGDNGMFGLCFYISSLFHDIIRSRTRKFPILNLCGPKGTGKTEMGMALMSPFGAGNKAPNLRNATIPALNYDIGLLSNALFHVDEYKNTLRPEMIEFLKGLYDCTGRKKMAGANYENSIMTSVKCGVIMSGQEVPVVDVALLHRCIFLSFSKSHYTQKELDRFNSFYDIYKNGLTHINIEFLKYRDTFELNYVNNYGRVLKDIMNRTENLGLEARITENWARIIASFLCVEDKIKFPFDYSFLLDSAVDHIIKQNKQCRKNDEIAKFWKSYRYLIAEGLIYEKADYQVKAMNDFRPVRGTKKLFDHPTKVLLLNPARVFNLAYKAGYAAGEKPIDNETLELYMSNASEFLGKKGSVRFDKILNGVTQFTINDKGKKVKDQVVLQALAFNAEMLAEKYGLEF